MQKNINIEVEADSLTEAEETFAKIASAVAERSDESIDAKMYLAISAALKEKSENKDEKDRNIYGGILT